MGEQRFRMQLRDLQFMQPIGEGQSACVHLVQHQRTGMKFALKHVKKTGDTVQSVAKEFELLAEAGSCFVQEFVEAFETATNMYVLTELLSGGDLFYALRNFGRTLTR